MFEWPQRADAQAVDITYKDRIEGRAGLTWEEKYLLQLGVLISLGRWETATQLIERGSAAGRLEYPALRRLLAEVTRALGVFGMNHFRDFLVEALGNQPEWDPDQDQLLQETTEPSATDEEKSAGVKKLAERSIHLFRCGLSLGLGYGAQAAQHMLQSKLEEQPCRQVISMLCYQFGFPLGMELAMRLDGGSGRLG